MVFRSLLTLLLSFCTAAALAHQQKAGISDVLFNQRSGKLEVAHRFYLHDAEHAIKHLFGTSADIHQDPATQQRFADYLSQQFDIRGADGEPLVLETLGHEIDGKFIWVYQEMDLPALLPTQLWFKQSALSRLWSKQINTVNIEARDARGARVELDGGKALSLSFTANDRHKSITLPKHWQ